LIKELKRHFLAHALMNAMGIIYPHYWEVPNVETTFPSHLAVLKVKLYHSKPKGANGTLVAGLLDPTFFDQQMSFFCLKMKSNNHGALHLLLDCNHIIKLWGRLTSNVTVVDKLLEYLKLIELTIVMVFGSVEDERTFSNVNFLKSKLCN
jgi:hypothetical protein